MQPKISVLTAVTHADEQLSKQVREMRELEDLKTRTARRAALLAAALERYASCSDDELVYVPGGLDRPRAFDAGDEDAAHRMRVWRRALGMTEGLSPAARQAVGEHLRASGLVRRAELESELARLRARHTALTTAYRRMAGDLRHVLEPSDGGRDPAAREAT